MTIKKSYLKNVNVGSAEASERTCDEGVEGSKFVHHIWTAASTYINIFTLLFKLL